MADGTDVEERRDETGAQQDDTDPGRSSFWPLPSRPTPKHRAPRAPREKTERSGSLLGMFAGMLVVLLIGSNVLLWIRSEEQDDASRVARVARVAAAQTELTGRLDELQASVEDLKGSVASVQQSVAGISTAPLAEQLAALQARADALTTCVNTYMDAIAAWTRNIANPFVYTRC